MNKFMGLREYARYRGCSHTAVARAISEGRLSKSIQDNNGKVKIDCNHADLEWSVNTFPRGPIQITAEVICMDLPDEVDLKELLLEMDQFFLEYSE